MSIVKIVVIEENRSILDDVGCIAGYGERFKVVGHFNQSAEAINFIKKHHLNAVLIDKEFTGLNVRRFAKNTALENAGIFVFVTEAERGGISFSYQPLLGFGKAIAHTYYGNIKKFLDTVLFVEKMLQTKAKHFIRREHEVRI